MNQKPVFFWITLVLLAMSLLGGTAGAFVLAFQAKSINQSGGWGWLMAGSVYVVAITIVCSASTLFTAISLYRREPYRPLSIAVLITSSLVVLTSGPAIARMVYGLRHQRDEASRAYGGSARRPSSPIPAATIAPDADKGSSDSGRRPEDPQILELKSKLWEAIRAKNADAFVDCFYVEERFKSPEIREENRNQIAMLLRGEIVDLESLEIPGRDLAEIMRIQNARPASLVRYSLTPRMMLRVWQTAKNGRAGRRFLMGEQNGRWYIVTLGGHTT